jgi:hypothetical protein
MPGVHNRFEKDARTSRLSTGALDGLRIMNNDRSFSELLFALRWYFESKNHALTDALKFRCPLSVENQTELRQCYSEYFVNLVSATELLLEKEYPYREEFKESLEAAFVFDHLSDGESNYSYIRELRNSIIHRGLDVCSAAHVAGDFPMVVAPQSITSRSGKRSYQALDYYLLETISKCEGVIGPVIALHLAKVGLLVPELTQDQSVANVEKAISESAVMPSWAKQLTLGKIGVIDHVEIQKGMLKSLVDLLRSSALGIARVQPGVPPDR